MADFVYVMEQACYSNRRIAGIYRTLEGAMGAHPVPDRSENVERPGGWLQDETNQDTWSNGLDWDEAKDITRHKFDD